MTTVAEFKKLTTEFFNSIKDSIQTEAQTVKIHFEPSNHLKTALNLILTIFSHFTHSNSILDHIFKITQ